MLLNALKLLQQSNMIASGLGRVESSGGIVREGLFEEVILELRPELERGSHL